MGTLKPRYKAEIQRDDNDTWFVRVPSVTGAHSHGRTISRAKENLREALALALDADPESFEVDFEFELPERVIELVEDVRNRREWAEMVAEGASLATRRLVRMLIENSKLSLRDVSELVGISFQRVQQIRKEDLAEHRALINEPTSPEIEVLMRALKASVEATRARSSTEQAQTGERSAS